MRPPGSGRTRSRCSRAKREPIELDLKGDRHGPWVRFRRDLERTLQPYEAWVFDQGEEALRSGGVIVAVTTGGDRARKARAVEILKSHGGRGVRYWGPKSMEIFF